MELSSQEGEIPIPIPIPINSSTTTYGHGNGHGVMIHHDQQHNIISSTVPEEEEEEEDMNGSRYKKKGGGVRYRECLKNHAAAMGGNATDGCGEFMPSGQEGTIEALNCSACHCHRNFHRKEVEGADQTAFASALAAFSTRRSRSLIHEAGHMILPSRTVPPHHMNMNMNMIMPPYNIGHGHHLPASESDEQVDQLQANRPMQQHQQQHLVMKKRFRTKFSQEQKEKMLNFAEKVGWKIQKQEDSVVQHFCQEIGVKRRVLKVWMHNNKHNLAKKNPTQLINSSSS